MSIILPRWTAGQKIGLLGGSFDPPHSGHLMISLLAIKRLQLDQLWWVVTPGNPLKSIDRLPDLPARLRAARAIARDPRIAVTGFEAEIGTRFTCDTIAWLTRRVRGVHFVWIMGADNLRQFHQWRNWRGIAAQVPILAIDRPGSTTRAASSRAAQALARYRVHEYDAPALALRAPPALLLLHGPRSPLSSTQLRREQAPAAGSRQDA